MSMLMTNNDVVVLSAKRTAIGGFQGTLKEVACPQLGAEVIKAILASFEEKTLSVDEVFMGCVLPAGLGQAPARQSCLAAGLPVATSCTTVNKMCGSGMKTVMLGSDLIRADSASLVVAGGMENMSQAPFLLTKARSGLPMGNATLIDSMFCDGLEDAYEGSLMGCFAQQTADRFRISREQMDDYAILSLNRSLAAIEGGAFDDEIVPVTTSSGRSAYALIVTTDEQPGLAKLEKIRKLKPAFAEQGSVTAANSSSISDGAAALLLSSKAYADSLGIAPLCRIVAHSSHAHKPSEFTLAPINAIKKVLDKAGWNKDQVGLYEINEAFAVVSLLAINELDLDINKVNVNGGACALGHPLGASGARILVTLIHALKQRNLHKGVAAICIGGGEAIAIAIEMY